MAEFSLVLLSLEKKFLFFATQVGPILYFWQDNERIWGSRCFERGSRVLKLHAWRRRKLNDYKILNSLGAHMVYDFVLKI